MYPVPEIAYQLFPDNARTMLVKMGVVQGVIEKLSASHRLSCQSRSEINESNPELITEILYYFRQITWFPVLELFELRNFSERDGRKLELWSVKHS